MPCNDNGQAAYEYSRELKQLQVHLQKMATVRRRFEAVLCGLIRAHGVGLLESVDWVEAGVDQAWVHAWWAQHQAADRARQMREASARRSQREAEDMLLGKA